MTPEQFKQKMKKISKSFDTEGAHAEADDLMCELLRVLGYSDGIDIYQKMSKWYA